MRAAARFAQPRTRAWLANRTGQALGRPHDGLLKALQCLQQQQVLTAAEVPSPMLVMKIGQLSGDEGHCSVVELVFGMQKALGSVPGLSR